MDRGPKPLKSRRSLDPTLNSDHQIFSDLKAFDNNTLLHLKDSLSHDLLLETAVVLGGSASRI